MDNEKKETKREMEQVSFALPEPLLASVIQKAAKQRMSVSELMENLAEKYLEEQDSLTKKSILWAAGEFPGDRAIQICPRRAAQG
jgi:predicted DsbA family dithiol-disulfide isomerase